MFVYECVHDGLRVAVPHPAVQIVARFGAAARDGVDVHAMGVRHTVHRKNLRGGQYSVTARLRLGTSEAVLGASASEMAERIVALDALWGDAAARQLCERLANARGRNEAVAILQSAIEARMARETGHRTHTRLALHAAEQLASTNVNMVADALGVSERHLRRVFRDTVGMSPKTFAKLSRFHRAIDAASHGTSWANIAATAGYYDQAHLIAEFKTIAGVTPRALLAELRAGALPR